MSGSDSSHDNQPITWLRGYPIHATTLLVLIYVVSMLVSTFAMALGFGGFLAKLAFSSEDILRRGAVWQFVTYALVNPPSFWFAIDMVMLWWFGTELEKFFGRRIFLRFYVSLLLLTPVFFTLLGLFQPMQLAGVTGNLALFIAFATLYPNTPIFFNILAKWAAVVLVSLQTLIYLSAVAWTGIISLWVTVTFAYFFVRYEQGRFVLPSFAFWKRKPRLYVVRDDPEMSRSSGKSQPDSTEEIDGLLEKISKSGMASLTSKEKAKLEKAREALMKREPGRQ